MNQQLIVEIYQHWDSSHDRTGQLIHRFDGSWHYGVALCNTVGLSWGPCEPGKSYALGQLVVHPLTDFSDAKWIKKYLRKGLVLENLIASVYVTSGTMDFKVGIVSTGHALSQQIAQSVTKLKMLFLAYLMYLEGLVLTPQQKNILRDLKIKNFS